ncbi:MAG: PilZ domain-containing protein [Elusimicrobia bacterium]|nr:PilZ domain-containing protein [Elusimicrobiota bacterium]
MSIRQSQRKYDRTKDTLLLDVYKPGAFQPSCRACLTDISAGGAGLESTYRFNLGDRINLVFKMEAESGAGLDGKEYVVDAIIRRVSRSTGTFSYGVEFTATGFFKRWALKRFVKKLLGY